MGLRESFHGSVNVLLRWFVTPRLLDRLDWWTLHVDINEFVTPPTPDFLVTPVTDET